MLSDALALSPTSAKDTLKQAMWTGGKNLSRAELPHCLIVHAGTSRQGGEAKGCLLSPGADGSLRTASAGVGKARESLNMQCFQPTDEVPFVCGPVRVSHFRRRRGHGTPT